MKVTGAAVISKPLPDLEDRLDPSLGEGGQSRKSLEEAFVVPYPRVDSSLLENDLGNPDTIRIPGVSPWQGPMGTPVPRNQLLLEEFPVCHKSAARKNIINSFKYYSQDT
jgi:hypothetical protein